MVYISQLNMARTVFFADLLGFSHFSRTPQAQRAVDALTDVASVFGDEDEILAHLNKAVWSERYALSDSLFLVSEGPLLAAGAAAELFFALAFYNSSTPEQACLIRGGLAMGEVRTLARSIFPGTGAGNLVGDAESARWASRKANGKDLACSSRQRWRPSSKSRPTLSTGW